VRPENLSKYKELVQKLQARKNTKKWLDGDKTAEKEVNQIREDIRKLAAETMSARERIDHRARMDDDDHSAPPLGITQTIPTPVKK
jgi:hypothetical protein